MFGLIKSDKNRSSLRVINDPDLRHQNYCGNINLVKGPYSSVTANLIQLDRLVLSNGLMCSVYRIYRVTMTNQSHWSIIKLNIYESELIRLSPCSYFLSNLFLFQDNGTLVRLCASWTASSILGSGWSTSFFLPSSRYEPPLIVWGLSLDITFLWCCRWTKFLLQFFQSESIRWSLSRESLW